jgi:N-methylhydantoinase B
VSGVDLVTVEVLQKLLLAAAEEMGITLIRAAYSPNIKERRDASCAVFDAEGQVIAQAAHIPMHLSSMVDLPRVLVEAYPRRSWRPGDMFVANDPYTSAGSHLNDIAIIAPVFADGELIGFVANTAHHADVGGRVPGSESGDSTSIFQDGLRLPVARLVARGRIEDGLFRTILLNSRTPHERIGDLRAQIAANRAGSDRLREICRQHGVDVLRRGMTEILDATERRLRDGIARMPGGCYEAEGFCDDDGREARPVRIRVAVRITGDRLTLDFTGTEAQVPGAKNVPPVSLLATVYYVLKAVIDPDIPPNGGYYRAIGVVAPSGTVLNPLPPAAVAARFTTCQTVADVVLSAFAQAVPERVVAHCHGGTLAIYSGIDPRRGEFFVDYEVYAGGSGARATKDGIDGIANHTTNTSRTCRSRLWSPSSRSSSNATRSSQTPADPAGSAAASRSCAKCTGWQATSWSAAGDATSARRPAGSAVVATGCPAPSRSSAPTVLSATSRGPRSRASRSGPARRSGCARPAAAGPATRWTGIRRWCSGTCASTRSRRPTPRRRMVSS